MRIHYIQNDPLATLGFIEEWANEKKHSLSFTRMYENENLPSMDDFDMLIILGGRMGAYEEDKFPWLVLEKNFIQKAIKEEKLVLGICLGAQMIANVLGGKVYPHKQQEIGWWPVELTQVVSSTSLFNGIPEVFTVFEFHGDTFDLPNGAIRLASSNGCSNQAFSFGKRVIGLQFHPEFTGNMICTFEEKLGSQIPLGEYIQNPVKWINQTSFLEEAKSILFTLLNNMEAAVLELNP
ncbi:type 1 glutamine amidotransferase [Bacillus sp. FJAT-29790]|uniref:type 1 glutamine amidotransferase n=1 Tax=Bacillus sp. FJAT-29790 TaxID=1895002 RepID=UPI001C23C398|nr:type 1 glutamine amidotransferase [Bacillus sp. FJAT-29790]MBU8878488.1 type 1 glutamine amidotransferase [Bacillus sp. FJAT-29790]